MASRAASGFVWVSVVSLLLVGGLSAGACRWLASARQPTVVLIVVDTLRRDHLALYGYPLDTAPHLGRLASQGLLFERVIASSSWTKTSMASLMTSLDPDLHGVHTDADALPKDRETVAQRLAAAGYDTVGINTNPWLRPQFGFASGFRTYTSLERAASDSTPFPRAPAVNAAVLTALADHHDGPLFLYVHYMDVHAPYRAEGVQKAAIEIPGQGPLPDEELEYRYRKQRLDGAEVQARVLTLYDAGITAADAAIGELLDELSRRNLLQDAVVVVTADHGEGFREHGTTEHGWNLYPEVYEVPLILVARGRVEAGRRVTQQVRLIDVAPTILALAGVKPSPAFEGTIIAGAGASPEARPARAMVGGNDYVPNLDYVAAITPEYLYVEERTHGRVEFYDLTRDPGARNDLGPNQAAVARLAAIAAPRAAASGATSELSDQTKRQLKALGYLQNDK